MPDPAEPAYIERDPATGIITREVWLKDGQRQRIVERGELAETEYSSHWKLPLK